MPEISLPSPAGHPAPSFPQSGTDYHAQLVVIGAGPGGYTAAFRAADLGLAVTLIETYPTLGGVCLNVGCIPSKALLHVAKLITDAAEAHDCGLSFAPPHIDLAQIRAYTAGVIHPLTQGLATLAKQRKIRVLQGTAQFTTPHTLDIVTGASKKTLRFEQAIVAVGSTPNQLPGYPIDDPRFLNSTTALQLADIPKRLLVIGGGVIGLEMATVYQALGTTITIVERGGQLIPGADPDMVRPLHNRLTPRCAAILTHTHVARIDPKSDGLWVHFTSEGAQLQPQCYDKVLQAVGRRSNGERVGAVHAGVHVNAQGSIPVDRTQRTNVPHIFAIGDVVGGLMLAHKATHEAKVAAENAAGHVAFFDARAIPSVAYTDPEVAWVGLTETAAKAEGVHYAAYRFPWTASGRALSVGRAEGITKILIHPENKRLLGAAMTGVNAGELIAEATLALEMGADIHDIGLTIHAHPTLAETFALSAECASGTITDLMPPKR